MKSRKTGKPFMRQEIISVRIEKKNMIVNGTRQQTLPFTHRNLGLQFAFFFFLAGFPADQWEHFV